MVLVKRLLVMAMRRIDRVHLFWYAVVVLFLFGVIIELELVKLHRQGVIGNDQTDFEIMERNVFVSVDMRENDSVEEQREEEERNVTAKPTDAPKALKPNAILPQKIVKTRLNLTQDFISENVRENIQRRQILNSDCDSRPDMMEGALTDNTLRHLYVSDDASLLYCCVPQAGCTKWKGILMVITDDDKSLEDLSSSEIHSQKVIKTLDTYTYEEQQYILETYTKFVYVRNPFVRLMSVYKNLFENVHELRRRPDIQGLAKQMLSFREKPVSIEEVLSGSTTITWEEFASFLAERASSAVKEAMEEHLAPVHELCDPCKVQYDYIGKMETVHNDSAVMLRELNFESVVVYPPRGTAPRYSIADYESAFQQLHQKVLLDLWKTYSSDFSLFDYPPPPFLPSQIP